MNEICRGNDTEHPLFIQNDLFDYEKLLFNNKKYYLIITHIKDDVMLKKKH